MPTSTILKEQMSIITLTSVVSGVPFSIEWRELLCCIKALFNLFNSLLKVLIATSTLAWGVNFPAHLVIVKGTEYYDGKTHRYVDYPITGNNCS